MKKNIRTTGFSSDFFITSLNQVNSFVSVFVANLENIFVSFVIITKYEKNTMTNSQNPSAIRDHDVRKSEEKFHRQITTKKIHKLKNTNLKVTSPQNFFFAIK